MTGTALTTRPCFNCGATLPGTASVCDACGRLQPQTGAGTALALRSEKKTLPALILCGLFGVFGVHRFYLGRTSTALLQLVTIGGLGIWWLVDLVLLLFGELRDGEGRKLDGLF